MFTAGFVQKQVDWISQQAMTQRAAVAVVMIKQAAVQKMNWFKYFGPPAGEEG